MTIGLRVKALRVERGMSLQNLADRSGISKTHVWNIEGDPDANPNLSTTYALAQALGITVVELLGLEGEGPPLHPEAMRVARDIDQLLNKPRHDGAAAGEREACARLVESMLGRTTTSIAAAIRARASRTAGKEVAR